LRGGLVGVGIVRVVVVAIVGSGCGALRREDKGDHRQHQLRPETSLLVNGDGINSNEEDFLRTILLFRVGLAELEGTVSDLAISLEE